MHFDVQTRKVDIDYYPSEDPSRATEWETRHRAYTDNFFHIRPRIMTIMQELGFTPYSEVCLLVDTLNPANWQGSPTENILTAEDGAEIRVLFNEG